MVTNLLPRSVTLLGKQAVHPEIDHADIRGKLSLESATLLFSPNSDTRASLEIPWEHIEECVWGYENPGGVEDLLLTPLTIITLGLVGATYSFVSVKFYDADYDLISTVKFKVGGYHDQTYAANIARRIWAERSRYRNDLRGAVTPRRL